MKARRNTNENDLSKLIQSLKDIIKTEIEEAIKLILKSAENLSKDKDFKVIQEISISKVNRIYLILSFLKKQDSMFEKEYRNIYEEYQKE